MDLHHVDIYKARDLPWDSTNCSGSAARDADVEVN
jgi:hypothetical protein